MLTKCRTRPQYVLWSNRGFSVQHPRVKHHQYQRHNNHNALKENCGHDDDAIALRGDAATAQANDRQGGARIHHTAAPWSKQCVHFLLFVNKACCTSCARTSPCGDDPAFLMFTRFLPGAVECLGDMGQCGVGSSCSSAPATGKSSHAGPWDRVVPMLLRGGVCRRNRDWTAPHGPVLARWWSSSHSWTTITPPWCRIVVLLAALGVTCQSTEGAYPLLVRASCGPELAKRLPACLFFPITKQ